MPATARDVIEQARALAPIPILTGALCLAVPAAAAAGLDVLTAFATKAAMFTAGCALVCLGLRDLTCRRDLEED